MKRKRVEDVLAFVVPAGVDPDSAATRGHMDLLAEASIAQQYTNRPRMVVEIEDIDWLVTNDPAEADAFQPAHDCAACLAGADQVRAFLREHPGRTVALANLVYTEVLPWEAP